LRHWSGERRRRSRGEEERTAWRVERGVEEVRERRRIREGGEEERRE
jgi:hypothetical protein